MLSLSAVWKSNTYTHTHRLTVRVIDRDGEAIGQAITQSLVSRTEPLCCVLRLTSQLSHTNLKYFTTSSDEFPTDAEVAHNVVEEGTWAAIVIQAGATAALQQARSIGNSSYNGTNAIHAYYVQARQENAVGSYLLPDMQAALAQSTIQFSAQSVAQL